MSRKAKGNRPNPQRTVPSSVSRDSSNSMHPVWDFEKIDTDGIFAFDLSRENLDAEFVLGKLISYSSMTWQEILRQTHDAGKSKHHELKNLDDLSEKAVERIIKKQLDVDTDRLFSFALDNKKRLIGIRNGAVFQVVWYDANHDFSISNKKHT